MVLQLLRVLPARNYENISRVYYSYAQNTDTRCVTNIMLHEYHLAMHGNNESMERPITTDTVTSRQCSQAISVTCRECGHATTTVCQYGAVECELDTVGSCSNSWSHIRRRCPQLIAVISHSAMIIVWLLNDFNVVVISLRQGSGVDSIGEIGIGERRTTRLCSSSTTAAVLASDQPTTLSNMRHQQYNKPFYAARDAHCSH